MTSERRMMYGGVVTSPDGVTFIAEAPTEKGRTELLVGYVRARSEFTIWEHDAAEIRALIDAGKPKQAIVRYFASVGQRWDEERLELWQHDADATFEWRRSGEFPALTAGGPALPRRAEVPRTYSEL